MARYKPESPDVLEKIKELEGRLSAIERTPQLSNSALDRGTMTVYSGQGVIRFMHNDGVTEMMRIGLFLGGFGPIDLFQINYLDGQDAFAFQSNLFGFEEWHFRDSTGNIVLGVDPRAVGSGILEGTGLGRPWISQMPFFPVSTPTADTTSSGTFVTLFRGIWCKQHPHGSFWVQYNVTATTGEVQVLAQGEVRGGPITLSAGTGLVNIGTFAMPGDHMETYEVEMQFRVASGAGAVAARVAAHGRERP